MKPTYLELAFIHSGHVHIRLLARNHWELASAEFHVTDRAAIIETLSHWSSSTFTESVQKPYVTPNTTHDYRNGFKVVLSEGKHQSTQSFAPTWEPLQGAFTRGLAGGKGIEDPEAASFLHMKPRNNLQLPSQRLKNYATCDLEPANISMHSPVTWRPPCPRSRPQTKLTTTSGNRPLGPNYGAESTFGLPKTHRYATSTARSSAVASSYITGAKCARDSGSRPLSKIDGDPITNESHHRLMVTLIEILNRWL